MNIEHIIIPGGGANFPILLGALCKLKKEGIWSYEKLKSIHGTSCGGLIGLMILLNPDWDDLYNYFINRPWNTLYEITPDMIFSAFSQKGLINSGHFEKTFVPFFAVREWDININLKDLYDITNIELNLYVTDFDKITSEVFNYKTHPELSVIKAASISAALPPVVSPSIVNNTLYVDGGLLANNPIKQALETIDSEEHDHILGFMVNYPDSSYNKKIDDDANILEYMSQLLAKLAWRCDPTSTINGGPPELKNTVQVTFESVTDSSTWVNLVIDPEYRKKKLQLGENYAQIFLNYIK